MGVSYERGTPVGIQGFLAWERGYTSEHLHYGMVYGLWVLVYGSWARGMGLVRDRGIFCLGARVDVGALVVLGVLHFHRPLFPGSHRAAVDRCGTQLASVSTNRTSRDRPRVAMATVFDSLRYYG